MKGEVEDDGRLPLPEQMSEATKELTGKKSLVNAWLMPSMNDLLFLVCLYWGIDFGTRFVFDGDTFWHILTGQRILDRLQIPRFDEYSHTMTGISWTAHEWLAEVFFAVVYNKTGLNGVILLSVILVSLTFAAVYGFLIYRKTNPLVAFLLTLLAAYASRTHWLARPHLFSFLLLLSFFIILELYQREKLNYLKFLPLLMICWVNVHASFIFGLMMLFLYASGNFILFVTAKEKEERAKKDLQQIWLYAVATLMATFLNPRGPQILLFPFRLTSSAIIMNNIGEWMSPNFHGATIGLWLLVTFVAILMMAKRRPDIFEAGLFLMLIYMSLYASRYMAVFAILMPIVVASRAAELIEDLSNNVKHINWMTKVHTAFEKVSRELSLHEQNHRKHLWIVLAIGFCMAISFNGGRLANTQIIDFRIPRDNFPVDALRFALKNEISGKMFNQEYWGGYLLLKSFPKHKVFFDGRSDMYGEEFMLDFLRVSKTGSKMDSVLEKYGVTWVIYEANSPLCRFLEAGKQWKLVYADGLAKILVKDIPENRAIIEKYPNVRPLPAGVMPVDVEEDGLDR